MVTDELTTQGQPVAQASNIPPPRADEELHNECEMHNYHVVNHVFAEESEVVQIWQRLKAIEGHYSSSMSALEMCLVPDMMIPPKFKVPDFKKHKGLNVLISV